MRIAHKNVTRFFLLAAPLLEYLSFVCKLSAKLLIHVPSYCSFKVVLTLFCRAFISSACNIITCIVFVNVVLNLSELIFTIDSKVKIS